MSAGATQVDPSVLRVLLRRLEELAVEADGVFGTVLSHQPDAGPGIAQATVAEVATGLSDAFTTLGASIARTRRTAAQPLPRRPVEIDLRSVPTLDQVGVVGPVDVVDVVTGR